MCAPARRGPRACRTADGGAAGLRGRRPPTGWARAWPSARPTSATTRSSASASCCRAGRWSRPPPSRPGMNLDDVRRTLRLGMGPCQGGFCTLPRDRASSTTWATPTPTRADGLLLMFLQHRWMGLEPILYGDQMRQACLDDWIFQGTLDVEHLPVGDARAPGMTRVVVVGAGLAGLVAGIRLAQGGAPGDRGGRRAPAGLHLSPGHDRRARATRPSGSTTRRRPSPASSPSARSTRTPRLAPEPLGAALAWFREATAALGHDGDAGRNMLLPTRGRRRPARRRSRPPRIAARDGSRGPCGIVVVGLRSLKDFFPALLADNLRARRPARRGTRSRRGRSSSDWSGRPGLGRRGGAGARPRPRRPRRARAGSPTSCGPCSSPASSSLLPAVARPASGRSRRGATCRTSSARRSRRSRPSRRRCRACGCSARWSARCARPAATWCWARRPSASRARTAA